MTHPITLRGQTILKDANRLYLHIHKPFGNMFSINDKLFNQVQQGKELVVRIDNRLYLITKYTPYVFREEVKSKFPNSPNWYRYWFKINQDDKQLEMF